MNQKRQKSLFLGFYSAELWRAEQEKLSTDIPHTHMQTLRSIFDEREVARKAAAANLPGFRESSLESQWKNLLE